MTTDDLIYLDGHENAILGYGNQYPYDHRVIYSKSKIIDNLVNDGLTIDDAIDLFNRVIMPLDLGEGTPIICDDLMVSPHKLTEWSDFDTGEYPV